MEPCHPPAVANTKRISVPYNNYYQKNTGGFIQKQPVVPPIQQQIPVRHNETPANNAQKIRKLGECWRCGDKWVHGHKCKLIPNVQAMQQEPEEQVTYDIEEQRLEDQAEQVNDGDQAMFLSAFAMGQQLAVPTPTVIIHINGKKAVALLDSGSTTSFINQDFAVKANCNMLPVKPRKISVAGGGTLTSTAVVPHCQFQISKVTLSHSFRTLFLPSHDAILGYDWFTAVSLVSFDIPAQQFSFTHEGKQTVSTAMFTTAASVKEMPAKKVDKLLDKGPEVFLCQIHNILLDAPEDFKTPP